MGCRAGPGMTGLAGSHSPYHSQQLLEGLPTAAGQPRRPSSQSRVGTPGDPRAGQPGLEVPREPPPWPGLHPPGKGGCGCHVRAGRAPQQPHPSLLGGHGPMDVVPASYPPCPCSSSAPRASAPPGSGTEPAAVGASPAHRVARPCLTWPSEPPRPPCLQAGAQRTHTWVRPAPRILLLVISCHLFSRLSLGASRSMRETASSSVIPSSR